MPGTVLMAIPSGSSLAMMARRWCCVADGIARMTVPTHFRLANRDKACGDMHGIR